MQHINSFSGGMKRGIDYTLFPQDSYTMMLNGTLVSKDEHGLVITNAKGTSLQGNFREGEYPIGTCFFNDVLYIITLFGEFISLYSYKRSSKDGWVEDELGLVLNMRGDTHNDLEGFQAPLSLFGYTTSKLLEVVAKESYDGSVDLYLCDGLNPNKIINTGLNKDGVPIGNRYYPSALTDDVFSQQSSISVVPSATYEIENYGNLKPGTYYLYLRYEDRSLNSTPFIKEVGPIFIHPGSTIGNSKNISGAINDGQTRVNKRILLKITDTDPNYRYISVGVVYYYGVNGILSRDNYLIDKSISLTSSNVSIIIDGNNITRTLAIEELLDDNISQNSSKTQVQLDGRLFSANWKGTVEFNELLRQYASRIIPHAVVKEDSNFDAVVDENENEFEYMEDEIYPLGVSFLIDGRYKTPVFPICGWEEGRGIPQELLCVADIPIVTTRTDLGNDIITGYSGGNVIDDGGLPVVSRGVCWDTSADPTVALSTKTTNGAGTGAFTSTMTGLLGSTTYYVRAYATNSIGTGYGNQYSFRTDSGIESVMITDVLEQTVSSAKVISHIAHDSNAVWLKGGVCWSELTGPTVALGTKTEDTDHSGSFESVITGLSANTLYYLRAYASNETGDYYSDETTFTTYSGSLEVETLPINIVYLTSTTAKLSGKVVENSGGAITEYGMCYTTFHTNPTTLDSVEHTPTGTPADYDQIVHDLIPDMDYYYRAYAINDHGTFYGEVKSFHTPA